MFADSVGTWMAAGMPKTEADEITRRLSVCNTCEHFNGTRCLKCGCFIALKTRMRTSKCPVGKW